MQNQNQQLLQAVEKMEKGKKAFTRSAASTNADVHSEAFICLFDKLKNKVTSIRFHA